MSEMPSLAAAMYLHAMVWVWRRKLQENAVWTHPNGDRCVTLGLMLADGTPLWNEMQKGWV